MPRQCALRCLTESNFGSPTASMELERCEKPPGAASSKRGSTSRECCVSGDDLVLRGSWQGSEEDGTGYLLTMRLRVLKLRIDAGGSSEHEVGEQLSQVCWGKLGARGRGTAVSGMLGEARGTRSGNSCLR